MLILISGITGMCGHACARAALGAGHQVRGLSRNLEKLGDDVRERLEGFVKIKDAYDLEALDRAVDGVDAIISAVAPVPEVLLEGQLLLLRAAERAGVTVFHAATWNFDWTKLQLGEVEIYDALITFWNHARLSSSINPIHAFTGIILDYMFYHNPYGSPINADDKTFSFFGTGDEVNIYTSVGDLAAYTIQAISEPDAAAGGVYHVESFRCSNREMADIYRQVRGTELHLKCLGTLEDVSQMLDKARATIPPTRYMEYNGLAFGKQLLMGSLHFDANDSRRWSHVKQTGLAEWLERNPTV